MAPVYRIAQNIHIKRKFHVRELLYTCIELNAHAIVLLVTKLKDSNRADLFLPRLFESQPCESMFRLFRSFTSTYSTVANCSVKEALSRISKIQLQNEIMHTTSPQFIYPRLKKKTNFDNKVSLDLPTKEEIIELIEHCQRDALAKAKDFGLVGKPFPKVLICKINPYISKDNSHRIKKKVEEFEATPRATQKLLPLPDLSNIQLKDHTGELKQRSVDHQSPYVEISREDGRLIIVKKTSLCWALRSERHKLSSDRLERVKYRTNTNQPLAKSKQVQQRKKTKKRFLLYPYKNGKLKK